MPDYTRRMSASFPQHPAPNGLASYFRSGDAIRSRSVSGAVLTDTLDVQALAPRLTADWAREISGSLGLEPGDVEALSLARARTRWPGYRQYLQAAAGWTRRLGLDEVLAASDIALMACRGARYHHDGAQYGGAAFCNLFLSEDKGLDLHFPGTGHRIPLTRGTAAVFDTGQPHAVIDRRGNGFHASDFPPERDSSLVFLTWELPIEDKNVARLLGIGFDIGMPAILQPDEERVLLGGEHADVCPASGRWLRPVR